MEDYVTYEQALRLRELGFNWDCEKYYATQDYRLGNDQILFDTISVGELICNPRYKEDENGEWVIDEEYSVLAPTIYQVQKWLYEVKEIYISVQYNTKIEKFQCVFYKKHFTQGYYCTNESYCEEYFKESENIINNNPYRCLIVGIDRLLRYILS